MVRIVALQTEVRRLTNTILQLQMSGEHRSASDHERLEDEEPLHEELGHGEPEGEEIKGQKRCSFLEGAAPQAIKEVIANKEVGCLVTLFGARASTELASVDLHCRSIEEDLILAVRCALRWALRDNALLLISAFGCKTRALVSRHAEEAEIGQNAATMSDVLQAMTADEIVVWQLRIPEGELVLDIAAPILVRLTIISTPACPSPRAKKGRSPRRRLRA